MLAKRNWACGKTVLVLLVSLWLSALRGLASQWNTNTSLPDGYSNHALVYASGFLYQTGGESNTNGESDGTNVFYAQVRANGSIGAWNRGTSLPEAIFNHASVAANNLVYVIGGFHYTLASGDIVSAMTYYANINPDGSLGSWLTANPLPDGRAFFSASIWNNRIYAIGGMNENSVQFNTIYSATIQSDGSLSAWTAQAPLPVANYTQAEAANGFLYVLGG